MSKPLVIANWKMNPPTLEAARALLSSTRAAAEHSTAAVAVAAPFVYLASLDFGPLAIAAQDCAVEQSGAFTGEISPAMLKDLGCQYVIIGHSERRLNFGEDDALINRKLKAAQQAGLSAVLCVGEQASQRKSWSRVIARQLNLALEGASAAQLILAYEPVWAIGTGQPCDYAQAALVRTKLSALLTACFGVNEIKVLYGGSVDGDNAKHYLNKAGFDGLLVGGTSLQSAELVKILTNLAQIVSSS